MNCAFFRFKDGATSSQSLAARPELEQALEITASTITNLYQSTAATPNPEGERGDTSIPSPPNPPDTEQTSSADVTTTPANDQETIQPTSPPHQPSELPFGYTLTFDDDDTSSHEEEGRSIISTYNTPSPTAFPTIQPPFTYSFHEPTFGARLERAALERAFHVLSTASIRPAEYQRLFRICRHFTTHASLLSLITTALSSPAIRPFSALTLHLGGAGLHYFHDFSASSSSSSSSPFSAASSSSSSAPSADIDVDIDVDRGSVPLIPRTPADNIRTARAALRGLGLRPTPALEADVALYAGVWLNSHDVERWLAGALGVRGDGVVGPRESVVKVERGVLERVVGGGLQPQPAAGEEEQQQEEEMTMQGLLDGECEIAVHSFRGAVEGVGEGVTVQLAEELGDDEWDRFCDVSTPWMVVDEGGAEEVVNPAVGGGERVAVDLDRFIKGGPDVLEVAQDSILKMYTQHFVVQSLACSA
ncbi:Bzip family transcription factor [Lasiodiplodia theobromae]|uniref:Uncharacterized protein n=1 Tax=Lasiodiplodia theobromae TaxID=45133 RepID=A0A5N5CWY1_9PEZI|nr:Bzip family transcription factor [Lasiodiplodia theobromae]KAB2569868.1 hypothetical protein DBV05_g11457 [Lasiodiplodia theobromae]KAF4534412.1 Bzip family transcription factor [Lasiodiplodia theobromae]